MENSVFKQFVEMETLWNTFAENHKAFESKGNKAAAGRARKAINQLKKLITPYKQANVDAVQESK